MVWSSSSLTLTERFDSSSTAAFSSSWAFGPFLKLIFKIWKTWNNLRENIVDNWLRLHFFDWGNWTWPRGDWGCGRVRFKRLLVIVRCDWLNNYVQMIGRDKTLGRIVHSRFVPVTVNASYQRQFVVLKTIKPRKKLKLYLFKGNLFVGLFLETILSNSFTVLQHLRMGEIWWPEFETYPKGICTKLDIGSGYNARSALRFALDPFFIHFFDYCHLLALCHRQFSHWACFFSSFKAVLRPWADTCLTLKHL